MQNVGQSDCSKKADKSKPVRLFLWLYFICDNIVMHVAVTFNCMPSYATIKLTVQLITAKIAAESFPR